MTNTEWKKKARALERTGEVAIDQGSVIYKHGRGHYSLHTADGNCVTVEWNLDRIKELVVD